MDPLHEDYGYPFARRFWGKVARGAPSECWEWTGTRTSAGYGRLKRGGHSERVHRIAWALAHDDPGDLCVLHRCDNPPCCNPDHLFLGTQTDNVADAWAKGRMTRVRGEQVGTSRLREDDVADIKRRLALGERQTALAALYGVSQGMVSLIHRGRSWRHVE